MPLPTIFAGLSTATGADLDGNFNTVGEFAVIPCAISGTNVLTLTPASNTPTLSEYANYMVFSGIVATTNTGAVTAYAAGFAVLNVYYDSGSGPAALTGGELQAGTYVQLAYDSALNTGAGGFHIVGSTFTTKNIAAGAGIATAINNGTVTVSSLSANLQGGPGVAVSLNAGTVTISETALVNATTANLYTLGVGDQNALLYEGYNGVFSTIVANGGIGAGWAADVFTYNPSRLIVTAGTIYGPGTSGEIGSSYQTLYTAGGQEVNLVAKGTDYVAGLSSPFAQVKVDSEAHPVLSYFGCMELGFGATFTGFWGLSIGQNGTVGVASISLSAQQSGPYSFTAGINVVNTGSSNVVVGYGHTTSGLYGLAVGKYGLDFGTTIAWTQATAAFPGRITQRQEIVMTGTGSATAAIRLTTDGSVAATTNTGRMLAGWGAAFKAIGIVKDVSNGGFAIFVGENANGINLGLITQSGSVATNAILSGFSMVLQGTVGSIQSLGSITIAADTTNGGFNSAYNPGAGNTSVVEAGLNIEMLQVV